MHADFETARIGGVLFYPALQLRISTTRSKEMGDLAFSLVFEHDRQIDSARLTMLPPPEERAMLRRIPVLATMADQEIPFRSSESRRLGIVPLRLIRTGERADIAVSGPASLLHTLIEALDPLLGSRRAVTSLVLDALRRIFAAFDPSEIDMTWQGGGASALLLPEALTPLFRALLPTPVSGDVILAQNPLD